MRYITIPSDVEVTGPDGTRVPYSFALFLSENVWIHPRWRDDETGFLARKRLREPLGKPPGEVAEISDKDYELLKPIALIQGQKIAPQFEKDIEPFHEAIMLAAHGETNAVG